MERVAGAGPWKKPQPMGALTVRRMESRGDTRTERGDDRMADLAAAVQLNCDVIVRSLRRTQEIGNRGDIGVALGQSGKARKLDEAIDEMRKPLRERTGPGQA